MVEYTEEEKELLRAQLREGSRLAQEAAIKRGAKLHPRIAEMRVAQAIRDVNSDTVGLTYTELTLAMARAAIAAMGEAHSPTPQTIVALEEADAGGGETCHGPTQDAFDVIEAATYSVTSNKSNTADT